VSGTELRLSDLTGRVVRDADGRRVGRIEELFAEIALREEGRDYVVTEFHVGSFGALETIGGGELLRHLLRRVGGLVGYREYRIPWRWMDLADPERPRVTKRREELETVD
jgi:hypothetical protein